MIIYSQLLDLFRLFESLVIFVWLPGDFLVNWIRCEERGAKRFIYAITYGLTFLLFVSYFFAHLSAKMIMPVFVSIFSIYQLFKFGEILQKYTVREKLPKILLVIVIVLASFSFLSSLTTKDGATYRGVNISDGLWNISLIQELVRTFPPQHPLIAGVPLQGYHFFYNLLVSDLVMLSGASVFTSHFIGMSILLCYLLVYSVYFIGVSVYEDKNAGIYAVLFSTMGGSFSFLAHYFLNKSLSLDDAFGVTQPISLIVSASYIFSLIILLIVMLMLRERSINKRSSLLIGLLASVAAASKVYVAPLIFGLIVFRGMYDVIKSKNFNLMYAAIIGIFLFGTYFLPFNASFGYLILSPFWNLSLLMNGNFPEFQFELKRQVYEVNQNWFGIVRLYVFAAILFIVGNLGVRLMGLYAFARSRLQSSLVLYIVVTSTISVVFGSLFIQPIGVFNTIQFFWYSLHLLGIIAGLGFAQLVKQSGKIARVLLFGVLFLNFISGFSKLQGYYFSTPSLISSKDISTLTLLHALTGPNDVILEIPKTLDIDAWFSSNISIQLTAYSNRRFYYGNEIVQFPYEKIASDRRTNIALLTKFWKDNSYEEVYKKLSTINQSLPQNKIRFIITPHTNGYINQNNLFKIIGIGETIDLYEMLSVR